MNVLLDMNILSRMAKPGHVQHPAAIDAAAALRLRGEVHCLVPQVLYEFLAVATRPAAVSGLGLAVTVAAFKIAWLKSIFPLLSDTPSVSSEWERLVTTHQLVGKNAPDARLVAAMAVHGITHLLTFNTQDFARYPGVTALDPVTVALPALHTSQGTGAGRADPKNPIFHDGVGHHYLGRHERTFVRNSTDLAEPATKRVRYAVGAGARVNSPIITQRQGHQVTFCTSMPRAHNKRRCKERGGVLSRTIRVYSRHFTLDIGSEVTFIAYLEVNIIFQEKASYVFRKGTERVVL